jgi:hypothetical protein
VSVIKWKEGVLLKKRRAYSIFDSDGEAVKKLAEEAAGHTPIQKMGGKQSVDGEQQQNQFGLKP